MTIESGVNRGTLIRFGLIFLMLVAFAAWFAWDGFVNYPRENLEAARQNFPEPTESLPVANPAVTAEQAEQFKRQIENAQLPKFEEVKAVWGEPAWLGLDRSGEQKMPSGNRVAFFVGPYGWARVTIAGDSATTVEWHPATYGRFDVLVQKIIAAVLLTVALVVLVWIVKMATERYVLDDEGLVLPGVGRVQWDQMLELDASDFAKKGVIRLKYRDSAGGERQALLDENRIARFDEIVIALCEKKGWQLPGEDEPGERAE